MISNTLSSSSGVGHFVLNNIEVMNGNFNKTNTIQQNFTKYFNYKYGLSGLIRNFSLLPWPRFTRFIDPHMPQPFLKSIFKEIWKKEREILEETSSSRLRTCSDVNQYLFRYWQLVQGKSVPVSLDDTKFVTLNIKLLRSGEIRNMITSQKISMLCLNDSESICTDKELEEAKHIIKDAFDLILPNKSSFEL